MSPAKLAAGGLLGLAAAVGIGRFIYTPILPAMVEDLALSKGEAGLIASANFVGYLVGALAAASPLLRGSLRAWLLAALTMSVATTSATAWPSELAPLLALRFAGGAASAYVLVIASALVLERLAAAGRSGLSSLHFAGVGTGIAVSSLATWGLAWAGWGWRSMWLAGGLLSAVALVLVARLIPDDAPGSRAQTAADVRREMDPRRIRLAMAYGLFGFGYVITATFIVAIVRASPEAAPAEPVFWLVVGLAAIPSVAVWVAAGRGIGVLNAFALACVVEAAGVLASVLWPTIAGLFVAAALLGATFMGLTALGLIAARDLAPTDARRWVGILTSAFGLGQIVGPLVAGYGFDLTGSFLLPSLAAVAALLIGAVLAVRIDRRETA